MFLELNSEPTVERLLGLFHQQGIGSILVHTHDVLPFGAFPLKINWLTIQKDGSQLEPKNSRFFNDLKCEPMWAYHILQFVLRCATPTNDDASLLKLAPLELVETLGNLLAGTNVPTISNRSGWKKAEAELRLQRFLVPGENSCKGNMAFHFGSHV